MFERLLLAIDDSPSREVAISFAAACARQGSASIHVLHVNEYLVGGGGLTLHTTEEAIHLVTDSVLQLRLAGVRAGGNVGVGSYRQVASRIADEAHRRHADVIVLGSRRNHRLGRLFAPQVRARTTQLTTLPVLTAPSPLKVTTPSRLGTVAGVELQPRREPTVST